MSGAVYVFDRSTPGLLIVRAWTTGDHEPVSTEVPIASRAAESVYVRRHAIRRAIREIGREPDDHPDFGAH